MSSSVLYRRCIIALLLASWCACIFALFVWGAIEIPLNINYPFVQGLSKSIFIDEYRLNGQVWLFAQPLALAGLGILGLVIWGQRLFFYKRRKNDAPWPWRVFLLFLALHSAWWVMQTLGIVNHPPWYQHLTQAGLGIFLFLALMAEQSDTRWGKGEIVFLCAAALLFCAFKFFLVGNLYAVDARIFLAIQVLPLLFIPTGIFSLSGQLNIYGKKFFFISIIYAFVLISTWVPNIFNALSVTVDLGMWWHALPWCALMFLLLLLMIAISGALQKENFSWMLGLRLSKLFHFLLNRLSFESLSASNRQKIS